MFHSNYLNAEMQCFSHHGMICLYASFFAAHANTHLMETFLYKGAHLSVQSVDIVSPVHSTSILSTNKNLCVR